MDIIFDAFAILSALLLLGGLIIRISNKKSLQFIFNSIVLVLISISLFILIYTNAIETHLGIISINPFSTFFMLIFTLGFFIIGIIANSYSQDYSDFALLANFALIGMYMVAFSNSLLTIFIGIELASIPSVFIILLSKRSLEAATKFFIMASIAIALLSFAIVLVYGSANSLALSMQPKSNLLVFASILFIASLGFETSMFPFNVLVPDVYQGSPAYVTGMLGGINKKMGFIALIQIFVLIFITYSVAFEVIAVISVITMFYGNISAIMQSNFKRMLAYSSISQAGYIMIGIATAQSYGIEASFFQIFAHMFIFIGIMSIVAWLESKNKNTIDDLIGLNNENRFAAFALSLFMLSLIGLPFTTGFIGKFLLFLGAIKANMTWLAILGIVNSIISVAYYARAIVAIYTTKANAKLIEMSRAITFAIAICLVITIVFGLYPTPIITLSTNAANYLFSIH